MTLAELKAWLEGYSAGFVGGAPNAEQWAEVQKRIKAARPEQAVMPYRYVPYTPPMWQTPIVT